MPNTESPNDWWPKDQDSMVAAYIGAHFEFYPDWIESGRPYGGASWRKWFVSVPDTNAWKLRRDGIHNGLTADLIATVELLGLVSNSKVESGWPGGIGAGGLTVWLPLLDGGLFVDFTEYEDQYTNAMKAYQKTLVFGAMALRYLLSSLDFQLPKGRLKGEKNIPHESEIDKLLKLQMDASSFEARALETGFDDGYEVAWKVAMNI